MQHVIFKELFIKIKELEDFHNYLITNKKNLNKNTEVEDLDFILEVFDIYLNVCKLSFKHRMNSIGAK